MPARHTVRCMVLPADRSLSFSTIDPDDLDTCIHTLSF